MRGPADVCLYPTRRGRLPECWPRTFATAKRPESAHSHPAISRGGNGSPTRCRQVLDPRTDQGFDSVVSHDIEVRNDSSVPRRNTMITAIRNWVDARVRDLALRTLITSRH